MVVRLHQNGAAPFLTGINLNVTAQTEVKNDECPFYNEHWDEHIKNKEINKNEWNAFLELVADFGKRVIGKGGGGVEVVKQRENTSIRKNEIPKDLRFEILGKKVQICNLYRLLQNKELGKYYSDDEKKEIADKIKNLMMGVDSESNFVIEFNCADPKCDPERIIFIEFDRNNKLLSGIDKTGDIEHWKAFDGWISADKKSMTVKWEIQNSTFGENDCWFRIICTYDISERHVEQKETKTLSKTKSLSNCITHSDQKNTRIR